MTAESQGFADGDWETDERGRSSQAEVNAQAPWFDGVREHIHDVKLFEEQNKAKFYQDSQAHYTNTE